MNVEFITALNEIEREKGVSKEIIFDALESALISSYKKNFGTSQNVEVEMNRETGEISLYSLKEVVDEVFDDGQEISLEDAKKINHAYEVGDIVKKKLHPENFGRIAAQTAKQVVIQRIKDAERDVIYDEYIERENEIITGDVQRVTNKNVFFDLGRTEALLPQIEQIPGERYEQGKRFKLLLLEVRRTTKGPQIILSRSHPNLIKRLFELEVPEISQGVVEIYSVAREAGSRTKIAVFSRDPEVDPLGACVGFKGARVKSIVDELHDEKVDIVIWESDISTFIANALSPSKVLAVYAKRRGKEALVVVPDYQLSLAIGREGQNARLAAKLTGWKIDIKSMSQFEEYLEELGLTEEEFKEQIDAAEAAYQEELEDVEDLDSSVSVKEESNDDFYTEKPQSLEIEEINMESNVSLEDREDCDEEN